MRINKKNSGKGERYEKDAAFLNSRFFGSGRYSADNGLCTGPPRGGGGEDAPPAGMVWVKIGVQNQIRSLGSGNNQNFIDYYEVYLRQRGPASAAAVALAGDGSEHYFTGSAEGDNILRVGVPPDYWYDVLLLAGTKADRTLLASEFVPTTKIESGRATNIELNLKYLESDPTDIIIKPLGGSSPQDIAIEAGTTAPYIGIMMGDPATPIPTWTQADTAGRTDFRVEIPYDLTTLTSCFTQLKLAEDASATATTPTFITSTMKIVQAGGDSLVTPILSTGLNDTSKISYTFPIGAAGAKTWPDPNPGAYAKMSYDIRYRAFGRDAAGWDALGLNQWHIKNGFDSGALDKGLGSRGGGILLIIGTDPGDFQANIWPNFNVNF